jgi:hypothetical protein
MRKSIAGTVTGRRLAAIRPDAVAPRLSKPLLISYHKILLKDRRRRAMFVRR